MADSVSYLIRQEQNFSTVVIIYTTARGVEIRLGKHGARTLKTTLIPLAKCRQQSAQVELDELVIEHQRIGYVEGTDWSFAHKFIPHVDLDVIEKDNGVWDQSTPKPSQIYWHINATDEVLKFLNGMTDFAGTDGLVVAPDSRRKASGITIPLTLDSVLLALLEWKFPEEVSLTFDGKVGFTHLTVLDSAWAPENHFALLTHAGFKKNPIDWSTISTNSTSVTWF